jgi:protein-tyrosine phosphatase
MIDLHTHILPGVDDGTRSLEEAREVALDAAAEGVTVLAATPHVRDDYPTTAEVMEEGVAELRADFAAQGIPVQVVPGAEVDIGILWALPPEELRRLTLAQTGRYLLLEMPYRGWPVALDTAVTRLVWLGITPLLAHPERNPEVQDRPERLRTLVDAGALAQVTAASLNGGLDRASQAAAIRLLELRLAHVLASDTHGPHITREGMGAATRRLADPDLARYLTIEAPGAIIAGEPVPERPS